MHWNLVAKDTFCSSSWDGCIKIVCLLPPTLIYIAHKITISLLHSGLLSARNPSSPSPRTPVLTAPPSPHTPPPFSPPCPQTPSSESSTSAPLHPFQTISPSLSPFTPHPKPALALRRQAASLLLKPLRMTGISIEIQSLRQRAWIA